MPLKTLLKFTSSLQPQKVAILLQELLLDILMVFLLQFLLIIIWKLMFLWPKFTVLWGTSPWGNNLKPIASSNQKREWINKCTFQYTLKGGAHCLFWAHYSIQGDRLARHRNPKGWSSSYARAVLSFTIAAYVRSCVASERQFGILATATKLFIRPWSIIDTTYIHNNPSTNVNSIGDNTFPYFDM